MLKFLRLRLSNLKLSKKEILTLFIFVLLLFAGIIALTQEIDDVLPELNEEYYDDFSFDFGQEQEYEFPAWVKPARWFRSNAGGLALEELQSRFVALRSEYALVIDYLHHDELPEFLIDYFDDDYFAEIRILYKNGEQHRIQWIFRDENGTTRLNAVFTELKEPEEYEVINTEIPETEEINILDTSLEVEVTEEIVLLEEAVNITTEDNENETDETTEYYETAEYDIIITIRQNAGFIEIFDENTFLTAEYRFFEDGRINKTEYVYNQNYLISSVFLHKRNTDNEYKISYTDYYRYNRSSSLRFIERVFYSDTQIEPSRISFPGRIRETVNERFLIGERFNPYPDFFGDIFAHINSKIIFETDERGRIITQTFYDDNDEVIWIIRNSWLDDRIISTSKTEGDIELLAEFEYNSYGDRILERNSRNGMIERIVRTNDNIDIEELFFNNVVVLRAVWEDGRKISETRIR